MRVERRGLAICRPHVGQCLGRGARMLRVFGDALKIGMHGVPEHGECDLRPALKKRAAELSLERDHGVGQRGLGHPATAGCPPEIALLAQRQEVADLLHLHRLPRPYHWPSCRGSHPPPTFTPPASPTPPILTHTPTTTPPP